MLKTEIGSFGIKLFPYGWSLLYFLLHKQAPST